VNDSLSFDISLTVVDSRFTMLNSEPKDEVSDTRDDDQGTEPT